MHSWSFLPLSVPICCTHTCRLKQSSKYQRLESLFHWCIWFLFVHDSYRQKSFRLLININNSHLSLDTRKKKVYSLLLYNLAFGVFWQILFSFGLLSDFICLHLKFLNFLINITILFSNFIKSFSTYLLVILSIFCRKQIVGVGSFLPHWIETITFRLSSRHMVLRIWSVWLEMLSTYSLRFF